MRFRKFLKMLKQNFKTLYGLERLKAFITDMFMLYTPLLYFTTYVILGSAQAFRQNQMAVFACVAGFGLLSSVFLCVSGQTPGLRYVGLKLVCTKTQNKVGFLRVLLRFFVWLAVASTLIGLLLPLMRPNMRLLHDALCNTAMQKV
ncbi:RDD family protein [Helicobacter sp. NHP22-001]|uniref:RDD family protein n=1 Tax=Helicobacter sp. NHP22-001 TaxID=3040202 RepID=UPI00244D8030|nr:RDD family protein [Helicobacter sp. NHP22-001]GMB96169.1 RDD family protein [Helicobacter sp. NHP22-001]